MKWQWLGFWLFPITLGILAGTFFLIPPSSVELAGLTFTSREIFFWSSVLYLLISLRKVKPGEIGVLAFFGKPLVERESGLTFVPFVIFELIRLPRTVQQIELPGEPAKIFRGEDKEVVPRGMVPPTRVTFTTSTTKERMGEFLNAENLKDVRIPFNAEAEEDGLSERRVTAEVVVVVRWRIDGGIKFVQNIGSVREVNRQIEDVSIALATRMFTQMSLGQALENLGWASRVLSQKIQQRLSGTENPDLGHPTSTTPHRSWGIVLESAQVKAIPLHHTLNSAIGSAAEAPFNKQQTITDAEAQRRRLELEGQGEGRKEREVLKGRTSGFDHMRKKLDVESETVFAAETARDVAENTDQLILVGKGAQNELLGTVASMGATFRGIDKNKKSGTDTKEEDA